MSVGRHGFAENLHRDAEFVGGGCILRKADGPRFGKTENGDCGERRRRDGKNFAGASGVRCFLATSPPGQHPLFSLALIIAVLIIGAAAALLG